MFNDVTDGGPASQTITKAPRPRVEGLPEELRGPRHIHKLRVRRAYAASSARFLGDAFVSSSRMRLLETADMASTAATNAGSFAFDGLLKPLIFRMNCREAARISSSVTGGSKLKRGLIFLHICVASKFLG